MDSEVIVIEVKEACWQHVDDISRLLAQLSSAPRSFSQETLAAIAASGNSHLFLAVAEGKAAGMLTLCHYLAPTGRKMWIEDVVVDEAMRGRSIGRLLVQHAIEYARTLGPGTLMLTSRPSREAANALYRSCGFVFKETNNYTMDIAIEG